jgi:hypothetical protein
MSTSSGNASQLHLRLYLEGIEVPVMGASVRASVGSYAEATISIIPTDAGLRIPARTLVHLFYYDADQALYAPERDPNNDEYSHYNLLFCGEVASLGYSKQGAGARSINLSCIDCSNLWDTTYQYQMNFDANAGESVVFNNRSTFITGMSSEDAAFDTIQKGSVARLIAQRASARRSAASVSVNSAKNSLGGLLSVLELAGGVHGLFHGVNDWTTIAERRLRLMDQISTDSGDSAAALFDQAVFEDWLTNALSDQGSVISFRDILRTICSYIFYDITPLPVARYIEGAASKPTYSETELASMGLSNSEGNAQLDPRIIEAESLVIDYLRSHGFDTVRRTSGYRTAEQQERLRATNTAAAQGRSPHEDGRAVDLGLSDAGSDVNTATAAEARSLTSLAQINGPFMLAHYALAHNPDAKTPAALEAAMESYGRTTEMASFRKLIAFYQEMKKAVADANTKLSYAITWGGEWSRTNPILAIYQIGYDPLHIQVPALETSRAEPLPAPARETRQKLVTQIFRPDAWFCAPPACNVLFPEEHLSLSFNHQLLRETTRYQLDTFDSLADSAALQTTYFAPQLTDEASLEVGGAGIAKNAIIYAHEKFSGIIPKVERMSEAAYYAANQPSDEAAESVRTWAGNIANFNFLRNRYESRSISVSAKFLPRIAVGFPMVIIDKPPVVGDDKPIQFVGMVRSATWSIDQNGAQTSIELSHARSPKTSLNEIDELFASTTKTLRLRGGNVTTYDVTVEQYDSLILSPEAAALFERAVAARAVDPALATITQSELAGVTGTGGKTVTRIDITGTAPRTTSINGAQTAINFSTIKVYEMDEESDFEAAVFPSWFSEDYRAKNIGPNVYQQHFGCGSIMDLVSDAKNAEDAIDKLADLYSQVTQDGTSASPWIYATTNRKHASTWDVLWRGETETTPVAFHYWAFGEGEDGQNLRGLDLDGLLRSPIETDRSKAIDPSLDPRAARYAAVERYASALRQSRAFRG